MLKIGKLAKKYHPDLNPNIPPITSQTKMAEIIQAYEQLLDDDFLGVKVGDGRVALACEMFTLEELRMDSLHDVYSIRIFFDDEHKGLNSNDDHYIGNDSTVETMDVSREFLLEINSHPEDSVSDLKRIIQERCEEEWGLLGRRIDRDKIRTGWELICSDRRKQMTADRKNDDASDRELSSDHDSLVMSYHLFVHSYGIQHGDIIHAVVRKYDE
jgi:curved DNA-binding protein CbpA